ncbi:MULTISPECIES: hypothetical protein [Streptomyces]|uniref:hypothetical protein n=1 Tax=Streptomyces TaxID=1883 RepID=UPI0006903327|nr:hypothetical protein [Streptomyces sp. NRRL S-4]KPC83499.1 hypothetical protein ADK82_07120 [Streptomyces sp. NRRL S-4]
MTTLHSTAGPARRRLAAPTPGESVSQPSGPSPRESARQSVPHTTDPPIYRTMLRHWESAGRTLPGRHDQEWNRIMTTPVWSDRPVRVSASRDPRGDGR